MLKARWIVVFITVLALIVTATGDADGRRCKRRKRCRRYEPRPVAPVPVPATPNPNVITFDAPRGVADTTGEERSEVVVPTQGDRHIVDVDVILRGVSHSSPESLGVILVHGARRSVLLEKVGGTSAVQGADLALDDEAARSLPDDRPLVSGTFKPTRGTGSSPDDPSAAGVSLAAFDELDPAGVWSLRTAGRGGSIAGWGIVLTLADGAGTPAAPADPPQPTVREIVLEGGAIDIEGTFARTSGVVLSATTGRVVDATLELRGLSHPDLGDLDIFLGHQVSLTQPITSAIVMSDALRGVAAGGTTTITLRDDAPEDLPEFGPLVGTLFRPANYGTGSDNGRIVPSRLASFRGFDPNGRWSVAIADDNDDGIGGRLAGWKLTLTLQ
jgi:hypothetical protein